MRGSGDSIRLAAVFITASLFGAAIAWPKSGAEIAERAEAFTARADGAPMSDRACAIGEPALSGPFAPLDDVLSVSPLGGVTAPGETLPAPYIRINTRSAEQAFDRRSTPALAPAKADIVAIERRTIRDAYGRVIGPSWTLHFRSCDKVSFYYDRLDSIDPGLLAKAGGLVAFSEFGTADHLGVQARIRVNTGDVVGESDGFDVGLHDFSATPVALARPERYRTDTFARAEIFDASPELMAAITTDITRARCPIEYLSKAQQADWSSKLGDKWGIRRAKGDTPCRAALVDTPNAAQGAWFTDASHNAATTKVSAIALSPDVIDPERLIFALHGRLPSLSAVMTSPLKPNRSATAGDAKDFLSFSKGEGRINTPFDEVTDSSVHCYQKLRTNFIGPLVNGVILLQRQTAESGSDLLKIEARNDVMSCIDLGEPWTFSGNETIFYR